MSILEHCEKMTGLRDRSFKTYLKTKGINFVKFVIPAEGRLSGGFTAGGI